MTITITKFETFFMLSISNFSYQSEQGNPSSSSLKFLMFSTAPQTKILFSHKTFFKNYFVILLFAKVATGRCSVRKVFFFLLQRINIVNISWLTLEQKIISRGNCSFSHVMLSKIRTDSFFQQYRCSGAYITGAFPGIFKYS